MSFASQVSVEVTASTFVEYSYLAHFVTTVIRQARQCLLRDFNSDDSEIFCWGVGGGWRWQEGEKGSRGGVEGLKKMLMLLCYVSRYKCQSDYTCTIYDFDMFTAQENLN